MTTTIVPFTPSLSTPFQFQAVLGSAIYTVIIKWNVFGQRWYCFFYDQSNTRLLTIPLVGSPTNFGIDLAMGYFAPARIIYRQAANVFEVHS